MRAHVSSLIFAVCSDVVFMSVLNNDNECAGVVNICANTSMGLQAGCQYSVRMVSLTPGKLCQ